MHQLDVARQAYTANLIAHRENGNAKREMMDDLMQEGLRNMQKTASAMEQLVEVEASKNLKSQAAPAIDNSVT